jgi:hypothetical protein
MAHISTLRVAQHCNWQSVPEERIGERIERQMIVGDQFLICGLRLEPHVTTDGRTDGFNPISEDGGSGNS